MPLPDQILKGKTFVDGDIVDGAGLNQLVDDASALKGLIMEQSVAVPIPSTDYIEFYSASAVALKRCLLSALSSSGVTSLSMTAVPASVFSLTVTTPTTTPVIALGLDPQMPNTLLAGPISGANAAPAFRAILPADTAKVTTILASNIIDADQGNVFQQVLTVNTTFGLFNGHAGQIIKVWLKQDGTGGRTVAWNPTGSGTMFWRGGIHPVMTPTAGHIDIFTFLCMGADNYYGYADQNFLV